MQNQRRQFYIHKKSDEENIFTGSWSRFPLQNNLPEGESMIIQDIIDNLFQKSQIKILWCPVQAFTARVSFRGCSCPLDWSCCNIVLNIYNPSSPPIFEKHYRFAFSWNDF